jgi:hypothetical protein
MALTVGLIARQTWWRSDPAGVGFETGFVMGSPVGLSFFYFLNLFSKVGILTTFGNLD